MSFSNTCQILVVDDFNDNLFLITTLFETENYQVESARSGKEALEKIEASAPNLVLMDFRLPDISGIEVTQQIRQKPQFANLTIILVTGDLEVSFDRVRPLGVNSLFHKPLNLETLLHEVKAICPPRSIPSN